MVTNPKQLTTKSSRAAKEPLPEGWIDEAIQVLITIGSYFLRMLFRKWF